MCMYVHTKSIVRICEISSGLKPPLRPHLSIDEFHGETMRMDHRAQIEVVESDLTVEHVRF